MRWTGVADPVVFTMDDRSRRLRLSQKLFAKVADDHNLDRRNPNTCLDGCGFKTDVDPIAGETRVQIMRDEIRMEVCVSQQDHNSGIVSHLERRNAILFPEH